HEDRAVERAARAEVEEVDELDGARQGGIANALGHERMLRARQRDPVHPDAPSTRVLEERSPPAADVEHLHPWRETEGVDRELQLPALRRGDVVAGRRVEAVRVRARLVEP